MTINLKCADPIARGTSRLVFPHPLRDGLLIKVFAPDWVSKRFKAGRLWHRSSWRRYHEQLGHLREMREQFALTARGTPHPEFVQRIVGFEETDFGMGMVVEAIRAPDGSLAPTIRRLLESGGLTPEQHARFDAFCDAIVRSPMVFTDFNANNVVFGSSLSAPERFVLIDGVGFKTLIPLERISKTINRRSKLQRIERLRRFLDLRRPQQA